MGGNDFDRFAKPPLYWTHREQPILSILVIVRERQVNYQRNWGKFRCRDITGIFIMVMDLK